MPSVFYLNVTIFVRHSLTIPFLPTYSIHFIDFFFSKAFIIFLHFTHQKHTSYCIVMWHCILLHYVTLFSSLSHENKRATAHSSQSIYICSIHEKKDENNGSSGVISNMTLFKSFDHSDHVLSKCSKMCLIKRGNSCGILQLWSELSAQYAHNINYLILVIIHVCSQRLYLVFFFFNTMSHLWTTASLLFTHSEIFFCFFTQYFLLSFYQWGEGTIKGWDNLSCRGKLN